MIASEKRVDNPITSRTTGIAAFSGHVDLSVNCGAILMQVIDEATVGRVVDAMCPKRKIVAWQLMAQGRICCIERSLSVLNIHLLEREISVATDAEPEPTQVMFDAERFRTALAVDFPLGRVITLLAKIAWAWGDLSIGRSKQPFHHSDVSRFQGIVRFGGITISVLGESLAPLADGVFQVLPALSAGQRDSSHLVYISAGSPDTDPASSRE